MTRIFRALGLAALLVPGLRAHIRIVDDWGVLTVTAHGALLRGDFLQITLPRPTTVTPPAVAGEGWTLELKPGWSIAPGARKNDFQLQSSAP